MLVLRELGLVRTLPDDDENLVKLRPDLKERVRIKTKEILIDDELRRRRVMKMTMIAEGAEAKRVEDSIEKRKRKIADDKRWEGQLDHPPGIEVGAPVRANQADTLLVADTREDRVTDWRSFQKGGKKKKAKIEVLG